MDEHRNDTPAPRRRRRADAQQQAFEGFEQAQKAEALSGKPADELPAQESKSSSVPQFEAPKRAEMAAWGDDDEPQAPVRKPRDNGKSKKKKKKK